VTVQEKPYPVASLVVDVFGEWLKHRRELKEMREMDAASLDRIAGELRMSSADLEALVRRGPHAADELQDAGRARRRPGQSGAERAAGCCATWSASARCATTSASATATSPPAPPLRI
jgi:hypothetical protein